MHALLIYKSSNAARSHRGQRAFLLCYILHVNVKLSKRVNTWLNVKPYGSVWWEIGFYDHRLQATIQDKIMVVNFLDWFWLSLTCTSSVASVTTLRAVQKSDGSLLSSLALTSTGRGAGWKFINLSLIWWWGNFLLTLIGIFLRRAVMEVGFMWRFWRAGFPLPWHAKIRHQFCLTSIPNPPP